MTSFRLFLSALGIAAAIAVTAGTASAAGHPCNGPTCNQGAYPKHFTLLSSCFGSRQPLPTFQAAPWYLYWPYDAHFLTPAPVTGAFYGPPTPGNFPVNPYFPGPAYGSFGPMPGGPPPRP